MFIRSVIGVLITVREMGIVAIVVLIHILFFELPRFIKKVYGT